MCPLPASFLPTSLGKPGDSRQVLKWGCWEALRHINAGGLGRIPDLGLGRRCVCVSGVGVPCLLLLHLKSQLYFAWVNRQSHVAV